MRKAVEQVLCYRFEPEKLDAVRAVMRKLGIECRNLPEESWREKVGFLLGRKGFQPMPRHEEETADFEFPEEVMVLDRIKGKRLDQVLKAMADAGISSIKYKAVATPFNTLWTLRRLCETMQKEHAYMMEGAKRNDGEA